MIKKITIAGLLIFVSMNVHAGKIIINENTTENVSSVQIFPNAIVIKVTEDSKRSYYIEKGTIREIELSTKELTDILLSKNSSVALSYDKDHDHPIQPLVQTIRQIIQTAN